MTRGDPPGPICDDLGFDGVGGSTSFTTSARRSSRSRPSDQAGADIVDIVIDTHKNTHTASFVAPGGGVAEVITVNTTRAGYSLLLVAGRRIPP